jgi:hypothetical protein
MTDQNTCILCGHERTEIEEIFFPKLEDMPYCCEKCVLTAMSVACALVMKQKPLDADISEAMSKVDWKDLML